MSLLTERYADKLVGQLSCYDRIIIQGTLPGLCYAGGMTNYLYTHNIRIFDYPRFAEPLRDRMLVVGLAYSLISGLRASVITDFLQMAFILVGIFVIIPWVVSVAG